MISRSSQGECWTQAAGEGLGSGGERGDRARAADFAADRAGDQVLGDAARGAGKGPVRAGSLGTG